MDGIVSVLGGCNQKIWIENPVISVNYVIDCHRIHVMNKGSLDYLVAQYTQIAARIPNNNKVTDLLPFPGTVEFLIDMAIKPES